MLSHRVSVKSFRSVPPVLREWENGAPTVVFNGDCLDLLRSMRGESIDLVITSPPYCMGKEYESSSCSIDDFLQAHRLVLPEVIRVTRTGGSICWQVGYHVDDAACLPLDYLLYDLLRTEPELTLRNRIVWTFGHGLHSRRRFSGRHETILWFTKGTDYHFDLDAVRVPQKYPGKRHYKGKRRGEFSGNPKGKNPSDVWDIPNVKANHVEKVAHPCQYPVGLADRLVRALSPQGGTVLDPFMGSSSTGVAAIINGRRFIGAEKDSAYTEIGLDRLLKAHAGALPIRPADKPVYKPVGHEAVARRPEHFLEIQG